MELTPKRVNIQEMHSGKARRDAHFLFSYQSLVCENNCDSPTGLFKGNPAEAFRSPLGLVITPSLLAEGSLSAAMDPREWVRV